jgi:Right handed beta helix region
VKISIAVAACAVFLAAAASGRAQPTLACQVDSQGQRYVDVARQFGRTADKVAGAADFANSQRCNLYFSDGTFSYRSFTLQGIRASGHGDATVLSAVDPAASSIFLRGDRPALISLKLTSPLANTRDDEHASNGVTVKEDARNFVVDHVTVDRVAGVGIHNFGGSDGQITSNVVRNSLADGIHNAYGARRVLIWGNRVTNAGDDLISVVSYSFDRWISSDIRIENNVVGTNPHGRGIAVVGGLRVRILGNQIASSYGAGIYVASEPGGLSTMEVDSVEVRNNVVREPDRGNVHQANILVWSGRRPVRNVYGGNNNVDRTTTHYDSTLGSKQAVRSVNDGCSTCALANITVTASFGA